MSEGVQGPNMTGSFNRVGIFMVEGVRGRWGGGGGGGRGGGGGGGGGII